MISLGDPLEPLRVPDGLWHRDDMRTALAGRDVRALFVLLRRHCGASQTRIGMACGMAQSHVSAIMRGRRVVTDLATFERIADGLGMPDFVRQLLGLAPTERTDAEDSLTVGADGSVAEAEGGRTKRRDALKLAPLAAVTPALLEDVLQEAAGEAMEFTRRAENSGVGTSTLEHLELAVARFKRAYSATPPADQFALVRRYRAQVDALLEGKRTLREGRVLSVYAGWLSEVLAWLAHDLGHPATAAAYCADSFQHGWQAEHYELCTWAADAKASIALYDDRPADALAAARTGVTYAPDRHPLAVRMRAQAARAHARLGQGVEFEGMLRDATEVHEALPARSPSCFGLDTAQLASYAVHSYAASGYIWLGQPDRARESAEQALQLYETAPAADRSPSREAVARIDLALALDGLGSPDEAGAQGSRALASPRAVDSVRSRATDLAISLTQRYRHLPDAAGEFVERYRELTSTP